MKVQAFVGVLTKYARILDAYGGHDLAGKMEQLVRAWSPAMTWSMKDLLRRTAPRTPLPRAHDASVRDFREALVRLQDMLSTIAKKDFNSDLVALIESLEPHDKKDLAAFVSACREALEGRTPTAGIEQAAATIDASLVKHYAERLQATRKDSAQFMPVYEELQADKRIKQAELAKIASLVAFDTAASTSKKESLRRIWLVHDSYATAAAKSRFSRGRSAA